MKFAIPSGTARVNSATTLLNVAVIPPPHIAALVAEMSRQLASLGGLYSIDNSSCYAHLTLYMARFDKVTIDDVRSLLRVASTRIEQIQLIHSGYFFTPGRYHEISYERSSHLLAAHDLVTDSLCPMRYSPGNPVQESYFGTYSQQQKMNARAVGYDLAGPLFRPHITISRMSDIPVNTLPAPELDLSFVATRIGLFRADENGSARQLIESFDIT